MVTVLEAGERNAGGGDDRDRAFMRRASEMDLQPEESALSI